MISFTVPKDMGYQYGTLIRQSILSSSECIRIIAFSLGEQTLLTSGNIDLISFSTELATLDIGMDSLIPYPASYSVTVKDVLTVGDLRQKGIPVLNRPDSDVLLDTVGEEVSFVFVCNKVTGFMSCEDNKQTLMALGEYKNSYKVIASRASDFKISFNIKKNLNSDEVNLSVTPYSNDYSISENSVIKDSLSTIDSILGSLKQKLS